MTVRSPTFTTAEHRKLDHYLHQLMEAVRDGAVSPDTAAGELGQLLAAIDIGNYSEPLARAARPAEAIAHLALRR